MATQRRKNRCFFVLAALALLVGLLTLAGCPNGAKTYTLPTHVSPPGAGSVSPPGGEYDSGVMVTLTATAASDYIFDYWSGSAAGTSPTTTITMDSGKNVTAHFKVVPIIEKYKLTTNVSPPGAGSVSPPGGEYDSGVMVTLTATAASDYIFDYWSGSAADTSPTTTVTMDSDKNATAYFKEVSPKVLFSDDFSDESSGWVTYDDYDGRVIYHDGCLYVKDYTNPSGSMYGESQRYFTDFILEVETWLVDGTDDNWHGVGCRLEDEDNYYAFGISADGYYEISKWTNTNRTAFVGPTFSSYINQGQGAINRIHIECIGSSLSLSVNGHVLKSFTDDTFTGGDISLAANSLSGTFTEVAFDNIVVTEP
jgi:uncharacterized repeat protein (TIGR02543 family)